MCIHCIAGVYSVVSSVTSSASPVPLTLFLCPPPRSQSVSVAPVSLNSLANDAIPSFVVYDCYLLISYKLYTLPPSDVIFSKWSHITMASALGGVASRTRSVHLHVLCVHMHAWLKCSACKGNLFFISSSASLRLQQIY